MDAYFARQPILDRNLSLFGYELLFRPNPNAQSAGDFVNIDGDYATASVLDTVNLQGIERATGGAYAFINFTRRLLLDGVAKLYPKRYLAVEVLENVEVDEAVMETLRDLKSSGYMIALDDYVYKPGDEELIELSDIIKIEVLDEGSFDNLAQIASIYNPKKTRLLAEKVETQEVFERASEMGCSLFQGYFFAKPKVIAQKTITSLKLNQLRLVRELLKPEIDFKVVSDIIKNDVGLSYKILRMVNSVYYGARYEIKNINQAVAFLGTTELKKWFTFTTLSSVNDDKPSELLIMSMARAHFCEEVAKLVRKEESEAYFLAGLFSLLDTLTDTPMEECIAAVNVPPVSIEALLETDNHAHDTLGIIVALEKGEWDNVSALCKKVGITEEAVNDIYMRSIGWARQYR